MKNKDFSCFKLYDGVFNLLINVKMPTIVGILTIYVQDKFHAQLRLSDSMKNVL